MKNACSQRVVMAVLLAAGFWAGRACAQTWTLGINWMTMNRYLDGGKTHTLFDTTIGCTAYHGPDYSTSTSGHNDSSAPGWALHSHGKMIFGFVDHATYIYSGAERVRYEAQTMRATGADSLRHFYFLQHPYGNSYALDPAKWEVPDSSAHPDVVVLSSNEFPTEWRDASGMRWCVAVKLQVAAIDTTSTHDAITVLVRRVHAGGATTITDSVHVPIAIFRTPNTDTVVISAPFAVGADLAVATDSVLVAVHSTRYVTTRIAWVTVEDTLARDILTYKDVDASDTSYATWLNKHYAIRDSIGTDTAAIRTAIGTSNVAYFALRDEPPVSEYTAMGEVNFLINYRGTTEVETPQNHVRYVKLVEPKVLWSGGFGAGCATNAYVNAGILNVTKPANLHCAGGSAF